MANKKATGRKSTESIKPKPIKAPAKFKLVRVKPSTVPKRHRTGKVVSLTPPTSPCPVVDANGNIDITNLSRTKLAKAVKVDLAHISRIFSGQRSPSLDLARRIADYMGVSLDKLQTFLDGLQP
jgi:DNA-binding XRE family transcriptional regulator